MAKKLLGDQIENYVQKQIMRRQKAHGAGVDGERLDRNIIYQNSKTAWVKLASGVSVTEAKLKEVFQANASNQQFFTDNKGMGLAKRHILFGGYGELRKSGNSNIIFQQTSFLDSGNNSYELSKDWGIIPMPGIDSIDVKSLNRGSLKKATIKLTAQNRDQLSLLDLLYMRLGYTVMLEWGWGMYYDNESGDVTKVYGSLIEDENGFFSKSFESHKSYLDLLPKIANLRDKNDGNVDALLGKVSNFNWSFNSDGSYSIEITVISLGDVVESLKTNVPPTNDTLLYVNDNGIEWLTENDSLSQHRKDNILLSLLHVFRLINLNPEGNKITIATTQDTAQPLAECGNLLKSGGDTISVSDYDIKIAVEYSFINKIVDKPITTLTDRRDISPDGKLLFPATSFGTKDRVPPNNPGAYAESFIQKFDFVTVGSTNVRSEITWTNSKISPPPKRIYYLNEKDQTSPQPNRVLAYKNNVATKTISLDLKFKDSEYKEFISAAKDDDLSRLDINPISKQIIDWYTANIGFGTVLDETIYNNHLKNLTQGSSVNTDLDYSKFESLSYTDSSGISQRAYKTFVYSINVPIANKYNVDTDARRLEFLKEVATLLGANTSASNTKSFKNPLKSLNYQANDCFVLNTNPKSYYIRFGFLLQILKNKVIIRIDTKSKKREDNPNIFDIDNGLDSNGKPVPLGSSPAHSPMLCLPDQISFDWRTCIVSRKDFDRQIVKQNIFPEIQEWKKGENVADAMNIYLNFNFIADQVSSNLDVKGNLSTYDFVKGLCDGINRALAGVNNLEPIIDEEDNVLRIFDSTPRSKGTTTKPRYLLQLYGYGDGTTSPKDSSTFVRKVDLKTAITPEYATMVTVGATANGYVKGTEATAFAKWNKGLTDRFKTELILADPDVTSNNNASDDAAINFDRTMNWTAKCFGLDPSEGDLGTGKIWEIFPSDATKATLTALQAPSGSTTETTSPTGSTP